MPEGDTIFRTARTLDRAPVQVSWALDAAESLNDRPVPFVRESREYWLDAGEAELQRGIALPTTAEAALIRISPHGNNVSRLTIDDVVIRSGGRELAGRAATQSVADETALRAAGMEVPDGTVIAKLAPAAGKGNLQLAAPTARAAPASKPKTSLLKSAPSPRSMASRCRSIVRSITRTLAQATYAAKWRTSAAM